MALPAGTQVGPYELLQLLGAGGMGEVYRARDPRLGREVAVKVLPERFAHSADRLRRFEREARTAGALNHPNILTVFDVGSQDGIHYLVCELLEGETLQALLRYQRLGVRQSLFLALQFARGLACAHEAGILHRDLKPGNLFLTRDGRLKILDFGLAKLVQPESGVSPQARTATRDTDAGRVLGTAAYMSPEQIRDEPLDGRCDIFALGAILYELMSQRPAFTGASESDVMVSVLRDEPPALADLGAAVPTGVEAMARRCLEKRREDRFGSASELAAAAQALLESLDPALADGSAELTAIIAREPDWDALRAVASPRIHGLAHRPLKKDPRERLRDIGDARIEIAEAEREPAGPLVASGAARPNGWRRRDRIVTLAAGVVLASIGAYAIILRSRAPMTSSPDSSSALAIHSVIDLPAEAPLVLGSGVPLIGYDSPGVAVSSDGSRIAYVGRSGGDTRLFLRDLSGFDVKAIPGTEGAIHPFFSPDGRWIGFLTNGKVKKVSLRGGAPVTLCDAQSPDAATWTRDDLIYFFADEHILWSVPAGRGSPQDIVRFTGALGTYRFNQMLPDGKSALLTDLRKSITADYADIVLMSIKSRQVKVLVSSGYAARYVPPGYLLFARAGSLLAVRFDASRGEVLGEPVTVATDVSMDSFFGQAQAAVSDHGLLVYVTGGDRVRGRLALVDRKGESEFLDAPARLYGAVDLAPAGDRLAVQVADVKDYIWIYDLKRREGRNLFAENAGWPVWSADGGRIAFVRPGEGTIWTQATAGREPPVQVVSQRARPSSWSPDGMVLALYSLRSERRRLGFVRLGEKPEWVHRANADEVTPDFSPDGRWVAYCSTEGGTHEIWVRSYPDGKTTRQVSVDGGIEPVWCPCGELFYRKGDRWMSTRVSLQPELSWEPPRLAFETDFIDTPGRSYDVTPDGLRLVVVKRAERETPAKIHLISNWLEVFERSERAVSTP